MCVLLPSVTILELNSHGSPSTVLHLLSSVLFLTPTQSCTPLTRVIEPSRPSPTPTEGPDATDSDITASSSSSSLSFSSSSSSFYATSSSSTSDKVSQLDALCKDGRGIACLEMALIPSLLHCPAQLNLLLPTSQIPSLFFLVCLNSFLIRSQKRLSFKCGSVSLADRWKCYCSLKLLPRSSQSAWLFFLQWPNILEF